MNSKKQNYKSYKPDKEKLPLFTIIPGKILADKQLTSNQKILLGLIIGLSKTAGYAYATNKYLAEALGKHVNSISRDITKLTEIGYIKTDVNPYTYSRKIYLTDKVYPP